jgi:hypothetical protein
MNSEGRIGLIPANYVEYESQSGQPAFRACALHTFTSEGGEELSFIEGQFLDILHV